MDNYSIFRTSLNNTKKIQINPIKYESSQKILIPNIDTNKYVSELGDGIKRTSISHKNPICGFHVASLPVNIPPLSERFGISDRSSLDTPISIPSCSNTNTNNKIPLHNHTPFCESKEVYNDDTPLKTKKIPSSPLSNVNNHTSLHMYQYKGIYSVSENNYTQFDQKPQSVDVRISFTGPIQNNNVDKNKQKKGKNKVTFEPNYNKIIFIYGLSFYNNNNIKNDVWWSSNELNKMRELVTNEVMYLRNIHPTWSISHCIREICKK